MSLSVNASNSTNPFAYLQSLWQQQGTSGTQAQSDPLSALLSSLTAQANPATASATSTTAPSTSTTSSSATSPQFGSQTLQALLALQANSASSQPLASQFGAATTGEDPTSALQSQPSKGGHHHHHHSMAANGSNGQTSSAASETSNSSGQTGNGAGNNALYKLLQMQAQLTPPAAAQSVTTA